MIVTSLETHLKNYLFEYSVVASHSKRNDATIKKMYTSILSGTQIFEIIAQEGQKGPREVNFSLLL